MCKNILKSNTKLCHGWWSGFQQKENYRRDRNDTKLHLICGQKKTEILQCNKIWNGTKSFLLAEIQTISMVTNKKIMTNNDIVTTISIHYFLKECMILPHPTNITQLFSYTKYLTDSDLQKLCLITKSDVCILTICQSYRAKWVKSNAISWQFVCILRRG